MRIAFFVRVVSREIILFLSVQNLPQYGKISLARYQHILPIHRGQVLSSYNLYMFLASTSWGLRTRGVAGMGFWNGTSALKQYFVLPKNGSKYYLKYTLLVFPVLGILGLGTPLLRTRCGNNEVGERCPRWHKAYQNLELGWSTLALGVDDLAMRRDPRMGLMCFKCFQHLRINLL